MSIDDARVRCFCDSYLLSFNATKAAIEAGYSPKTAGQAGYRFLQREDVQAYLMSARGRMAEAAEIDQDRVMRELARIAFSDLRDVARWGVRPARLLDEDGILGSAAFVEPLDSDALTPDVSAAISEVSQTQNGIKIKMHDKLAALDKIARHLGFFEKDNTQAADALARLIEGAQGTALPLGVRKEQQE